MNDIKNRVLIISAFLINSLFAGGSHSFNQRYPRQKNVILSSVEEQPTQSPSLATQIYVPQSQEISAVRTPKTQVVPQTEKIALPAKVAEPSPVPPIAHLTTQQEAEKLLATTQEETAAQEEFEQEKLAEIKRLEEAEDTIEFNFDNASLGQLINYIAEIFNYTFIAPDIFNPLLPNDKPVNPNLITFKTNRPLSRQEAWDLFVTFIDMSGFAVVPQGQPNIWRIMPVDAARRAPVPTFIGIAPSSIPASIANSDQIIRYIYFIENTTVDALVGGPGKPPQLLDQLKSPDSVVLGLKEHNAILMIDKAYNIINLMQVVKELDKVSVPQAMSVLKLRRADAKEVKDLYDTLIKPDDKNALGPNRLLQRRQPQSMYFPESTKIIAEPRSNSLILLGPIEAIQKIEDFIIQYVDIELDKPFSPLFVYPIRYADAKRIADIMNDVTKLGKDKPVGQVGGLRGVDKYFSQIDFFPEESTNRLIIKGDYEDYLKAVEIIKQLDEPQPQVAIEVLLLALNVNDLRILGTQMRKPVPCGTNGILGPNVSWATSGIFTGSGNTAQGIIANPFPSSTAPTPANTGPGVTRLLGDLLDLVVGTGAGNTIVSLGDQLGAWAVIQALQSISSTQTIANPFLLATNKTKAQVAVGVTQRVVASQVIQTGSDIANTFKDETANLTVNVVPLINSDGMITLDLDISIENFIGVFNVDQVQKSTQAVSTKTVVANKEVIALGGLIETIDTDVSTKVPILGDIPILGWLFKNKNQGQNKTCLLALVSTQIIEPEPNHQMNDFTRRHVSAYQGILSGFHDAPGQRDPIRNFFFENSKNSAESVLDNYMFVRHKQEQIPPILAQKRRRNGKLKNDSVPAPDFVHDHRVTYHPQEPQIIPAEAKRIGTPQRITV